MIGYIWTRESNVYDEEKYSIKSQLDACLEKAQADGITIPPENIYRVQFSGVDQFEIAELDDLFRRVEADKTKPKRIYCYRQDRMIRGKEGEEIFYITTRFRRARASVVFVKDGKDLDTIAGKIQALVEGIASAKEVEKIKDNTMRGKRKRVVEGKIWGLGRDKFGYVKDREAGIALIDESQAEVIKRIFREVCEGKGLMTIAKDLNRDCIPTSFTRRGEKQSQWYPATVRVLLRDPAYKGEVWAYRYGGEAYRMPDGLFPAIVEPGIWTRAQERLETNRGEKARNQKYPALLRGLIFCRACGARMYPHEQHRIIYYRCSSEFLRRQENGSAKCGGKSVRAERIEDQVWQKVLWLINNPDQLIKALDLARASGAVEQLASRLSSARRQIEQRGAEQIRLARRLRQASGRVASLIEEEIQQIEVERGSLEREAESLEKELLEQQSWRIGVEEVYETCKILAESENTFEDKRRGLERLNITVVANGRSWRIRSEAFLSTSKLVINKTYSELAQSEENKD